MRLRPILLTTATTVLGLLPMALGLGDGAEIRTPMALTVIFGLTSSTVLTLVVIPVMYYRVMQVGEGQRTIPTENDRWVSREAVAGQMNPSSEPRLPEDQAGHMASGLTEFSLRRRITVLVLLLSIVVVGVVATVGIPLELFPRGYTGQSLFVFVPWPNAPTQEVLDKITLPLEEELSTVRGLDNVNSFSTLGASQVFLRSNRAPTWTWRTAKCATASSGPGCSSPTTSTGSSSARRMPPAFPCA